MKKILAFVFVAILTVCICCSLSACAQPVVDPIDDNYRVFYQIFVGSFSDSDGDGVGDLRGIINRMDYLNDGNINSGKSLGVQGLWLSPIFSSPTYHKYDATDYYKIDKTFGTEQDLKDLLEVCHERNVKVILDLAINHTSTLNQWFLNFKSARTINNTSDPYYNFYTCVTESEKVSGRSYYRVGTTDWFYEGNFESGMPELNFDNPAVFEETVNIAKYYMNLGVDGFRFDAIPYIYYGSSSASVSFWEKYVAELKKVNPEVYLVGECNTTSDTEVLKYYTAMNCFSFSASGPEGKIGRAVARDEILNYTRYVEDLTAKMKSINPDALFCPFLSNHDMNRISGFLRIDTGDAKMAANVYLLCAGSPFIYYGEEIGMKGSRSGNTDANRRLAMLWGDNDTIQNPEGSNFDPKNQINGTVKQQLRDKNSLLNYYAKVIALRNKYPEIARGSYTSVSCNNKYVGGFKVVYNNSTIGIFHNTGDEEISITLPAGADFTTVCDFIGKGSAKIVNGNLVLGPQTSVIVK